MKFQNIITLQTVEYLPVYLVRIPRYKGFLQGMISFETVE
jgi:hypothetical protein